MTLHDNVRLLRMKPERALHCVLLANLPGVRIAAWLSNMFDARLIVTSANVSTENVAYRASRSLSVCHACRLVRCGLR